MNALAMMPLSGKPRLQEDRALLEAAAGIARQFSRPRPLIYWSDLGASAGIGYASFGLLLARPLDMASAALFMIAVLALYRAESFIHELTHIDSRHLPGFRTVWNAVIGIPLLTPSFLYEGVHNLHHGRTIYGTKRDPEYLPLAGARHRQVMSFVLLASLAPFGLVLRFAILAPLSFVSSKMRTVVIERLSALAINPAFRRRRPTGSTYRRWLAQECATSIWTSTIVLGVITGAFPLRPVAIGFAVLSAIAILNQVRTLAAHLWQNDEGEQMNLTEQYLDSVNVPPPALLPALWAPVGLRYHGLHHLLPSVPYHSLGNAHHLLSEQLGSASTFHRGNYGGFMMAIARWINQRDT